MFRPQQQMSGLVRTFVCIAIPDDQRRVLARWIDSRRRESHEVRWVDQSVMHITLKFCGETEHDTVNDMLKELGKLKHTGPLDLAISGVGGFPNLASPRVVWAGITGGTEGLSRLQRNVEDAVWRAGIPKERRSFSPHLTLGRRNSQLPVPEMALRGMSEHELSTEPWHAEEFILMRSDLSPMGPRYTPLGLFKI